MSLKIKKCPDCEAVLEHLQSPKRYHCPECGVDWVLEGQELIRLDDAGPISNSDRFDEESEPDSVVPGRAFGFGLTRHENIRGVLFLDN
jgi:hypothetical protein